MCLSSNLVVSENGEGYERRAYCVAALAIILVSVVFAVWNLYPDLHGVGACLDLLTVIASAAAFWASLRVLEKQRGILYDLLRAPWFYISAGLGLWLVAETIWFIYAAFLGRPLEVSLADSMWLSGYVSMIFGLYRGIKPLASISKDVKQVSRKVRLATVIPIALGVLLLALVITSAPREVIAKEPQVVVIDNLYMILDLVLLALTLQRVAFFYGGKVAKGPALFSLGLALMAISDMPYFVAGGYYPGNLLDLIYVISYIVIATGIYIYSKQPPVA